MIAQSSRFLSDPILQFAVTSVRRRYIATNSVKTQCRKYIPKSLQQPRELYVKELEKMYLAKGLPTLQPCGKEWFRKEITCSELVVTCTMMSSLLASH